MECLPSGVGVKWRETQETEVTGAKPIKVKLGHAQSTGTISPLVVTDASDNHIILRIILRIILLSLYSLLL